MVVSSSLTVAQYIIRAGAPPSARYFKLAQMLRVARGETSDPAGYGCGAPRVRAGQHRLHGWKDPQDGRTLTQLLATKVSVIFKTEVENRLLALEKIMEQELSPSPPVPENKGEVP